MTTTKTKSSHRKPLPRGGKRQGAGRPHGSGKYGEPTKAMRVPQSLVGKLQHVLTEYDPDSNPTKWQSFLQAIRPNTQAKRQAFPLFEHKIPAGFPSPADDHMEMQLDLNEHLVQNPNSTFFVRVEGDSMIGAGIFPNDILIVDLSLEPTDGQVVIALVDGDFTVKRLKIGPKQKMTLMPENDRYVPIQIKEGMDCKIWGVVTNVIHSLAKT